MHPTTKRIYFTWALGGLDPGTEYETAQAAQQDIERFLVLVGPGVVDEYPIDIVEHVVTSTRYRIERGQTA